MMKKSSRAQGAFTPGSSPLASPYLHPVSPARPPPPLAVNMKRVPSGFELGTTGRLLPSTSSISLLSLTLGSSSTNLAGLEEVIGAPSIGTVLEEDRAAPSTKQRPRSALAPAAPVATSTGQYLNSVQQRRVSHYASSASQRSSMVNLAQMAGPAGAPPISPSSSSLALSLSMPRSRRESFGPQLFVPDSPALAPVSICGSPSRLFLAATPGSTSGFDYFGSSAQTGVTEGFRIIDMIQGDHNSGNPGTATSVAAGKDATAVRARAAQIAAALESEIFKTRMARGLVGTSGPVTIPMRHEGPDAAILSTPELRPVETPAEMPTPMVLDTVQAGGRWCEYDRTVDVEVVIGSHDRFKLHFYIYTSTSVAV